MVTKTKLTENQDALKRTLGMINPELGVIESMPLKYVRFYYSTD